MTTKSSLDLLTQYGGDSSDEEVPGPRVSTKRAFKDDTDINRLPVPKHFVKNDSPKDEIHIDDPELHEGRVRSFAHERGNWATFVYIPLEAKTGISELCSFIEDIIPKELAVKISTDLHISLTKTVVLKYHWITPFVQSLKGNLEHFKKFIILLDGIKVYCNEEHTRTFIGLTIKSGYDTLLGMTKALDGCLAEFMLPKFYKDPSFHISIAWSVGNIEQELKAYMPKLNNKFLQLMDVYDEDNFYFVVENLLCKSGNKYFQFHLS